mgnify:CR=1 FL=1
MQTVHRAFQTAQLGHVATVVVAHDVHGKADANQVLKTVELVVKTRQMSGTHSVVVQLRVVNVEVS